MTAVGVGTIGVEAIAGDNARAYPEITLTSPTATVTGSSITVSYTYTSPVSAVQASYQIQLRIQDGSTILFNTGVVSSASSSSLPVAYVLSGGSTYQLWVRAIDQNGDSSSWAILTFVVESTDVSSFADETRVGSVFEIAINGVGYMLADTPERPVRRQTAQLQAPRFAQGDTPFSEAVERYTYVGQSDFTGGAGQNRADRNDSLPTRFWDAEGINPFSDEALQLTPPAQLSVANTYTGAPYSVVVGTGTTGDAGLYVVTDSGELTHQGSPGGSSAAFTITGAGTCQDLCTDGVSWYYADGSNIYQNDTNADPGSAWSTVNATTVAWCGDRIGAAYIDGSSNLAITTLDDAGAEEVAGGRFKYPQSASSTASCPDMTGGDGYMWFIVNRTNTSRIHYWQLGSSDTYAAIGLTLPAGQVAQKIDFYLGQLFIQAVEFAREVGEQKVFIYRAVQQNGLLTPQLVTTFESNSWATGEFAGNGSFVAFAWPGMTKDDGFSGIGVIDLETGGFTKWQWSDNFGAVYSVSTWFGGFAFSVLGDGVWYGDDFTELDSSTAVSSSGWLITSVSDLGSSMPKVIDETRVTFDALPSDVSVSVDYTVDNGNSFLSAGAAVTSAGLATASWHPAVRTQSYAVRLNLSQTGGETPKVRFVQSKLHPEVIADQIAVFPINCGDEVDGLNNHPIRYETSGIERLRQLEALISTRVRLQDVDWPTTGTATIWEVVSVEDEMHGVYSQHKNRRVDTGVASVTLRREVL